VNDVTIGNDSIIKSKIEKVAHFSMMKSAGKLVAQFPETMERI